MNFVYYTKNFSSSKQLEPQSALQICSDITIMIKQLCEFYRRNPDDRVKEYLSIHLEQMNRIIESLNIQISETKHIRDSLDCASDISLLDSRIAEIETIVKNISECNLCIEMILSNTYDSTDSSNNVCIEDCIKKIDTYRNVLQNIILELNLSFDFIKGSMSDLQDENDNLQQSILKVCDSVEDSQKEIVDFTEIRKNPDDLHEFYTKGIEQMREIRKELAEINAFYTRMTDAFARNSYYNPNWMDEISSSDSSFEDYSETDSDSSNNSEYSDDSELNSSDSRSDYSDSD